ncbi:MAG: hypothetical protein AB1523_02720 [Bacillota bacterium]
MSESFWAAASEEIVMDKMPLTALVFQSIPESIILFALGLTLMGVPLRWKRIVPAALILSATSYLVRSMPLPYGIHTIASLLALYLLFIILFRTPILLSAIAALSSLIALLSLELLLWPFIFFVTNISIKDIWHQPILRIVIPLPELALLSIITWWCKKNKITLSTFWPFHKKQK